MKKLILLSSLVFGLALPLAVPSSIEATQAANETYYFVLGKTGLYQGEVGTNYADLYLENAFDLELAIGDALPGADEITSTSEDVMFSSWVCYENNGSLSYYSTAPKTSRILYALYDYVGTGGGESSSDDSSQTGETFTIYFEDASWWNKYEATTSIYLWEGSNVNAVWPGEVMTHVVYDSETGRNIWSFDISGVYSNVIFVRTGSDGADWGAKTIDISLADRGDNNMYSIASTTELWGDPGVSGTWTTYGG